MRRLWVRMAEIYGHRWTSAVGEDAATGAGETWAKGLAGLTPEQVGCGLERAIVAANPWPPTLPEFRAMCLGIPSFAAVRLDLRDANTERAPFTRLAWSFIDSFAYRQASEDKADRMLRDAFNLASDHVMAGGELPKPAPAVEHTPSEYVRPPNTPTASESIDDIRRTLSAAPDYRAKAPELAAVPASAFDDNDGFGDLP